MRIALKEPFGLSALYIKVHIAPNVQTAIVMYFALIKYSVHQTDKVDRSARRMIDLSVSTYFGRKTGDQKIWQNYIERKKTEKFMVS